MVFLAKFVYNLDNYKPGRMTVNLKKKIKKKQFPSKMCDKYIKRRKKQKMYKLKKKKNTNYFIILKTYIIDEK